MKQKNIEKYKINSCENCIHLQECKEKKLSDEVIKCGGNYKWK